MNLRREQRYSFRAAATFSWQDKQGARRKADGVTHDLSEKGAFIYTLAAPPEHVSVSVEIRLRPRRELKASLQVVFKGRVLRVEEHAGINGFAVRYKSVVLRRSDDS